MSLSFLSVYGEEELSHIYSLLGAEEKPTLEFWKRHLRDYSLEKPCLTFTVEEIVSSFTIDGLIPGFFEKSITELLKQKDIYDTDDISKESSADLVTYLFSTLWSTVFDKSVDWKSKRLCSANLLNELRGYITSYAVTIPSRHLCFSRKNIPGFQYNFLVFLEASVNQILDLNTRQIWLRWIQHLSVDEMNTIISKLVADKVLVCNEKVIKVLPSPNDSSVLHNLEAATANLDIHTTLHSISCRLGETGKKIQDYTKSAILAKSRSDVQSALMFLKLKKNAESTQRSLLQAQYNLEECLQTIEGNEVNKIVVSAYASASKALKTAREDSEITLDSIETAMEMFQEEMDNMQEIGDSLLSSSVASITEEEKSTLEKELEMIIEEEASAKANQVSESALVFPHVPTTKVKVEANQNVSITDPSKEVVCS